MGKKRNFQGREAFHRMNFLYQACHLMQSSPNASKTNLSAYYGQIMTGVAKKTVLRIDPSIKRTICKGCHNLLVPGMSSKVRVVKKNSGQVQHLCLNCQTLKRFNLKRNYKIWSEKEESVVEVFNCKADDDDLTIGDPRH